MPSLFGISTLKLYSKAAIGNMWKDQQNPSKSMVSSRLTFNQWRKRVLPCRCQVDPREGARDSGSRWPLQHSGTLQGQRASGGRLKRSFSEGLAGWNTARKCIPISTYVVSTVLWPIHSICTWVDMLWYGYSYTYYLGCSQSSAVGWSSYTHVQDGSPVFVSWSPGTPSLPLSFC